MTMPYDSPDRIDAKTMREATLRHLSYSLGKDEEHASVYDWRVSLSLALRDMVVDPWFESTRTTYAAKSKRVYYLSMEFLIGRLGEDVAINLRVEDVAREALEGLGQDYSTVVADEPDAALGNGGLGRLAACFLDSLSTLGIPPMATASATNMACSSSISRMEGRSKPPRAGSSNAMFGSSSALR